MTKINLTPKDFVDAPIHYNNEEASAWAAGYNAALEDHQNALNKIDEQVFEKFKECSPTNRHTMFCRCDGRAVVPGPNGVVRCPCEKCRI